MAIIFYANTAKKMKWLKHQLLMMNSREKKFSV